MPHVTIAVSDTIHNPALDRVCDASRVAVFDESARNRWSSADVVRPSPGGVEVSRKDGVAIIAVSKGASSAAVKIALESVPDPVVIIASERSPSKALAKVYEKRRARVVVPGPGGVVKVFATNTVNKVCVEVKRLSGADPAAASPKVKSATKPPVE